MFNAARNRRFSFTASDPASSGGAVRAPRELCEAPCSDDHARVQFSRGAVPQPALVCTTVQRDKDSESLKCNIRLPRIISLLL